MSFAQGFYSGTLAGRNIVNAMNERRERERLEARERQYYEAMQGLSRQYTPQREGGRPEVAPLDMTGGIPAAEGVAGLQTPAYQSMMGLQTPTFESTAAMPSSVATPTTMEDPYWTVQGLPDQRFATQAAAARAADPMVLRQMADVERLYGDTGRAITAFNTLLNFERYGPEIAEANYQQRVREAGRRGIAGYIDFLNQEGIGAEYFVSPEGIHTIQLQDGTAVYAESPEALATRIEPYLLRGAAGVLAYQNELDAAAEEAVGARLTDLQSSAESYTSLASNLGEMIRALDQRIIDAQNPQNVANRVPPEQIQALITERNQLNALYRTYIEEAGTISQAIADVRMGVPIDEATRQRVRGAIDLANTAAAETQINVGEPTFGEGMGDVGAITQPSGEEESRGLVRGTYDFLRNLAGNSPLLPARIGSRVGQTLGQPIGEYLNQPNAVNRFRGIDFDQNESIRQLGYNLRGEAAPPREMREMDRTDQFMGLNTDVQGSLRELGQRLRAQEAQAAEPGTPQRRMPTPEMRSILNRIDMDPEAAADEVSRLPPEQQESILSMIRSGAERAVGTGLNFAVPTAEAAGTMPPPQATPAVAPETVDPDVLARNRATLERERQERRDAQNRALMEQLFGSPETYAPAPEPGTPQRRMPTREMQSILSRPPLAERRPVLPDQATMPDRLGMYLQSTGAAQGLQRPTAVEPPVAAAPAPAPASAEQPVGGLSVPETLTPRQRAQRQRDAAQAVRSAPAQAGAPMGAAAPAPAPAPMSAAAQQRVESMRPTGELGQDAVQTVLDKLRGAEGVGTNVSGDVSTGPIGLTAAGLAEAVAWAEDNGVPEELIWRGTPEELRRMLASRNPRESERAEAISRAMAEAYLSRSEDVLASQLPGYREAPVGFQAALLDAAYNTSPYRVARWRNMAEALARGDYAEALYHTLNTAGQRVYSEGQVVPNAESREERQQILAEFARKGSALLPMRGIAIRRANNYNEAVTSGQLGIPDAPVITAVEQLPDGAVVFYANELGTDEEYEFARQNPEIANLRKRDSAVERTELSVPALPTGEGIRRPGESVNMAAGGLVRVNPHAGITNTAPRAAQVRQRMNTRIPGLGSRTYGDLYNAGESLIRDAAMMDSGARSFMDAGAPDMPYRPLASALDEYERKRVRAERASGYESYASGGLVRTDYREGGKVKGPGTSTSDSIPAMLSDGEFVINAKAVDKVGPGLLHRINVMGLE